MKLFGSIVFAILFVMSNGQLPEQEVVPNGNDQSVNTGHNGRIRVRTRKF